LKKGDKVSITYQKIGVDFGDGCVHIDRLKSVKIEAEADCPNEKIGSPKTVEAVFLETMCGDICSAGFRLSNGEILRLQLGGEVTTEGDGRLWFGGKVVEMKEGDKVSLTYQKRQYWELPEPRECNQSDNLESVTVLPK
jgi:hypothetical protein